LKYTEKHPDVIRLKNQIAKLEKQLQQSSSETSSEETEIPQEQPTNLPLPREIQNEIVRLNAEIEKLKEERQNLLKTIAEYQRRVEITPKVEKEYQDLIRGYEVLREEYQSLLEKKLDAELAANMEKAQKGEQFRILDPAKVPEKPYKPNRFKIVFLGIALGLGAGVGLAFLMEFYIDTSFYRVEDLETFTELPVLALIPKIKQK
ncbi:MAG: protein GumC, partial [Thermoproteota archaeon]